MPEGRAGFTGDLLAAALDDLVGDLVGDLESLVGFFTTGELVGDVRGEDLAGDLDLDNLLAGDFDDLRFGDSGGEGVAGVVLAGSYSMLYLFSSAL